MLETRRRPSTTALFATAALMNAAMAIASPVSTILAADQIIVLDAGRIVGIGTHQELMSTTEPYREIVASQLGEEAVA